MNLINAILLGLLVGIAEEFIFRLWLLIEINSLLGPKRGVLIQALIYSFVHLRFDLGFIPLFGLLIGLFLLGLVLAQRRRLDQGSIWGCIGLHGGLVGLWFFISNGVVEFSPDTPAFLFGPGGSSPNPVGGLIAISVLSWVLFCYRTEVRIV